ncbi:hypothetical protein ES288_D11G233400v1 [Gossypium darwinii]|uniref:Uncharacterized protein n=1 Tax=Gossypium darwinii TaxID=34276 RepID=A0A5D2AP46_GOSDA|nr:hypothetical protein ES288_D11G233400v1 [Gossypium darwinii]
MARPTSSGGGSSSSSEEDGDAEWKAAIQSIAATTTATFTANGSNSSTVTTQTTRNNLVSNSTPDTDDYVDKADEIDQRKHPQKLKNYQLKAQKLLDNMLEKHLVIVKDACNVSDADSVVNESGVRLFKNSTPGIVFDHVDEIQGPRKKPKLLPRRGIDENSKEFRRQLRSIAVDGKDILAAARDASQRSLARLEAKEATAKERAKREEARITELKRIRGERWLPSMARQMQVKMGSNAEAAALFNLFVKKPWKMTMAVVLAVVIDGLGLFVRTLWDLQERRFSATFNAVTSAAISITMALVVCLLSLHGHATPEIGVAYI